MIVVPMMDQNVDILRVISHLRDIGVAWRGRDELHCSLFSSLKSIIDTINRLNSVLYNIALYREIKRQEYN